MKKPYNQPKLVIHGTLEQMTQFLGTSGTDTLYFGGSAIGTGTGSTDGDFVPRKQ